MGLRERLRIEKIQAEEVARAEARRLELERLAQMERVAMENAKQEKIRAEREIANNFYKKSHFPQLIDEIRLLKPELRIEPIIWNDMGLFGIKKQDYGELKGKPNSVGFLLTRKLYETKLEKYITREHMASFAIECRTDGQIVLHGEKTINVSAEDNIENQDKALETVYYKPKHWSKIINHEPRSYDF
jgi:flagellar biosynthesis regulator FlaF